jgi:hypothetical protein
LARTTADCSAEKLPTLWVSMIQNIKSLAPWHWGWLVLLQLVPVTVVAAAVQGVPFGYVPVAGLQHFATAAVLKPQLVLQVHFGVSLSGSQLRPSASVVWYSPNQ